MGAGAEKDRFGLSWNSALLPGILEHLHEIDLVEVIAEGYLGAPRRAREALRWLAAQLPVALHGVSLGPASAAPIEGGRLDRWARLVDEVAPEYWSEHLAFVRGGGVEIGHLAAPPRTPETVEGTLENLERILRVVGRAPLLENVATLIDPPGSRATEPEWTSQIIEESGSELLLDLHNLYANACNFGFDPVDYLARFPLTRVRAVHLSGGKWIPEPLGVTPDEPPGVRLLDDHLHRVPEPVFELLTEVGARVSRPLVVVLERDDAWPSFEELVEDLRRARAALARGRVSDAPRERRESQCRH